MFGAKTNEFQGGETTPVECPDSFSAAPIFHEDPDQQRELEEEDQRQNQGRRQWTKLPLVLRPSIRQLDEGNHNKPQARILEQPPGGSGVLHPRKRRLGVAFEPPPT